MTDEAAPRATKSLDADGPIESREHDELGRRSWAEAIAREIASAPAEHGFTLAIVGAWGSGKTSVLNMVAETLVDDEPTTAVLRFNPWLFGGAADLVSRFFGELSAQLGEPRYKRLAPVGTALAGLGELLATLSPEPSTSLLGRALRSIFRRPSELPSLAHSRNRLTKALEQSGSRIVVLIDDIDRLETREIREVMRLVRLTSDLPNVVFLLAFDREQVAESLGEAGLPGQQYLEKIVQVTYELPAIRRSVLREMLFAGLNELIDTRNLGEPDQDAWMRVFPEVMQPLFGNVRDVKRYLNSLPVALDAVGREVALADLLGLEAVRVLRPWIFEDLRAHQEYLVQPQSESHVFVPPAERTARAHKELSAMIDRAGDQQRLLESVFESLFPITQEFLGHGSYGSGSERAWRRARRVASEEVLRIYLEAGLDDGALPSTEVDDLFAALTDEVALVRILDGFSPEQFEEALERLEDYQYDYPIEAVDIAVPVLLNRMDRLSDRTPEIFRFSPQTQATRVILRVLRRDPDPANLAASAQGMLARIDRLSGWLTLIRLLGPRQSSAALIHEEDIRELGARLLEQLASATAEELAAEWSLAGLSFWTLAQPDSDDKAGVIARLRGHLNHDEFVLNLLRTGAGHIYSDKGHERRFEWDALLEVLGSELDEAVRRLDGSPMLDGLPDEDRDLIELAKRYATGWRPVPFGEDR
ncbi:MAG: P-loop NTPase fold protein [Chloroflexi bacterium]|nr:P-loop NTPase fold protein [Chloroflexota bacterium]